MTKRIDRTGQRYGRLVATRMDPTSKPGRLRWICQCDCGSEKPILADSLSGGRTNSCGCIVKEVFGERYRIDHTGKRFGSLEVIRYAGRLYGVVAWECRCDCGAIVRKTAGDLVGGKVKSCSTGCRLTVKRTPIHEKRARWVLEVNRRRARKKSVGGTFTQDEIDRLHRLQRGRCAWCGTRLGDKFHRDHKLALSHGGSNDISNIELLCAPCNLRKGTKHPEKWAQENGRLL